MSQHEEDEEECRVCRGPAEEGNPLYKPCKCSGSIALVHQDCLQSWMEAKRSGNSDKCELCKHTFRFRAQYAPDAPKRLSFFQVWTAISRKAIVRWLPFSLRVGFALSLWLIVAPLVTVYLYHCWMKDPYAVYQRATNLSLLSRDLVSGAILTVCIIISFLSIMSFIDFLRGEWQQQRRGGPLDNDDVRVVLRPPANEIDDCLWDAVQQQIVTHQRGGVAPPDPMNDLGESDESWSEEDGDVDDDDDDIHSEDVVDSDEEEDGDGNEDDNNNGFARARQAPRVPARVDGNDLFGDDPGDADIQLALGEFLAIRGPMSMVISSLLWLLAFNAVYLGLFAFSPKVIGTITMGVLFNGTEWRENATAFQVIANATNSSLLRHVAALEVRSEEINSTFRLHQVVQVFVGYMSCAMTIFIVRGVVLFSNRLKAARNGNQTADGGAQGGYYGENIIDNRQGRLARLAEQMDDDHVEVHILLSTIMDATVSITKVGVLLFLKMFSLPIFLGLCLDGATLPLFGSSVEGRIAFAGEDFFSFLLLHWVIGISSMLLVTVSVLQLREVVHPDLLSHTIRPQEPQPDLLGNLMNESAETHVKRMILSLLIYAILLTMHIYLPVRGLILSGILDSIGPLRLKYCHMLMPELQIPLELLTFHLCMLALLEKYKNKIGEMQHYFLKMIAQTLRLSPAMLPMDISSFKLLGARKVFDQDGLSEFWLNLAKSTSDMEPMITANLSSFEPPSTPQFSQTLRKQDGSQVLFDSRRGFIRLPLILPGPSLRSRSVLLKTEIGRYRLSINRDDASEIQVWVEVKGQCIPRPPEGWDDLAAGGAHEQGRWAWVKEKKSAIEKSVSKRDTFFPLDRGFVGSAFVVLKLLIVFLFSWISTTLVMASSIFGPLFTGRAICSILCIPEKYIHDPFAFAVGMCLFFPIAHKLVSATLRKGISLADRLASWLTHLHPPPAQKMITLASAAFISLVPIPLLFGALYHILLIKPSAWFGEFSSLMEWEFFHQYWTTGFFILSIWCVMCVKGVLTKEFWPAIYEREGPQGNANNGDAEAAAWHATGSNGLRLQWQGSHGRLSRFF